jgi:hypothetical protein
MSKVDNTQTGMLPGVTPEAQLAFKDLMIHGVLQFTLRIAVRCVLHRCKSQDIHC